MRNLEEIHKKERSTPTDGQAIDTLMAKSGGLLTITTTGIKGGI